MKGLKFKGLLLILAITLTAFTLSFTISRMSTTASKYEETAFKVMGEVSALRGLKPPGEFKVKVVSLRWAEERWLPAEGKSPLEWKIYQALLLIPRSFSYEKFERKWAGCVVAASSGDTLYLVSEMVGKTGGKELKRTLAHEAVHILQYVHFRPPSRETLDGRLALSALVEGDADLTADMLVEGRPREGEAWRPESLKAEEALMLLKLFPYHYGESFASYLYEKGGWSLLNQAYRNPPASTEQILHPEKYLKGEGFEEPKPSSPPEGWKLEGETRMGEYFVWVLVAKGAGYRLAERASEGWNGDRAAYYTSNGSYLLVWTTCWDSLKDAQEFVQAFTSIMEASAVKVSVNLWKAGDQYMALKSRGLSVEVYASTSLKALEALTGEEDTLSPSFTHYIMGSSIGG